MRVGKKAEVDYGDRFLWVLGGIPEADARNPTAFEYFIIPSRVLAANIKKSHEIWSQTPGKRGQQRDGMTSFRNVHLPPANHLNGWSIDPYRNRWETFSELLSG